MGDTPGDVYSAKTWFQLKCEDPDTGHLWRRARILCTFKKTSITALYLFNYTKSAPTGEPQKKLWSEKVHNAIRILFDRIVTRWMPKYLTTNKQADVGLNNSLTPENLFDIPQTFGNVSLTNVTM